MHCADASVPDNLSVRSSVGARGAGQPSMDPEMRSLATSAHGWPAAQGPRPIIIPANDTEMLVESAFLGNSAAAAPVVSFEHKQTFHMLSDPRRINLMASKKVPSRPCPSSWEGPRPTTYKPLVEARKRLRQSGNDAREQNFVRETLPLPLTPNDMSQSLGYAQDLRSTRLAERDFYMALAGKVQAANGARSSRAPPINVTPRGGHTSPTRKHKERSFKEKKLLPMHTVGDAVALVHPPTPHLADEVYETVMGCTTVHKMSGLAPMVKREELVRRVGSHAANPRNSVLVDRAQTLDIHSAFKGNRLLSPDLFQGPGLKARC